MFELKKCKRDGCSPILQSRGQMKPEDHHAQFARYHSSADFMATHGVWLDLQKFYKDAYDVEQDSNSVDDIRVSCSRCGRASPWMRRDIEEYRRHGDGDYRRYTTVRDGNMEAAHKLWNEGIK